MLKHQFKLNMNIKDRATNEMFQIHHIDTKGIAYVSKIGCPNVNFCIGSKFDRGTENCKHYEVA